MKKTGWSYFIVGTFLICVVTYQAQISSVTKRPSTESQIGEIIGSFVAYALLAAVVIGLMYLYHKIVKKPFTVSLEIPLLFVVFFSLFQMYGFYFNGVMEWPWFVASIFTGLVTLFWMRRTK